jgi:hypothetical protein
MLTTLSYLKQRLAIPPEDTTQDALLTQAIAAISSCFDRECNRSFARQADATFEFSPRDLEISPDRYPIESVSKFELKFSEPEGWLDQPDVQYLIRSQCIISLSRPLNSQLSTLNCLARVTYTAGYVLPGDPDPQPSTLNSQHLPPDIEHAALDQLAAWFLTRDLAGLTHSWPSGGTYKTLLAAPLLPAVSATLQHYRRCTL